MNALIYYLIFILLAIVAIYLFWPLIIVLGILFIGFRLYLYYHQKKVMKEFNQAMEDMTGHQESYWQQQRTSQNSYRQSGNPDIIDVEYTEKEEK